MEKIKKKTDKVSRTKTSAEVKEKPKKLKFFKTVTPKPKKKPNKSYYKKYYKLNKSKLILKSKENYKKNKDRYIEKAREKYKEKKEEILSRAKHKYRTNMRFRNKVIKYNKQRSINLTKKKKAV
ncbi:MAG: hypothetical protein Ta2D_00870 [Rickettsiales bacterium]|nr:MAG: hypothetical protein Ta2D_00870 [Rickettsiales bacterium]